MDILPHIRADNGRLIIGGVDAVKLARKYGTPLYVYSEDAITERMREYLGNLRALYPSSDVAYASKAYLTLRMAQLVSQEGLLIDVASGGELFIALKSGFPPERILLHGNNKTFDELELAITSGVGRIVADSTDELKRISRIAAHHRKTQTVLIRLAPGIDAHTHKYLATGEIDSKFGIPMHRNWHLEAATLARSLPGIDLAGFHCHVGSQIFDVSPFVMAVKTMIHFYYELYRRTGFIPRDLDVGGGLGISYTGQEEELPVPTYAQAITSALENECASLGIPKPHLIIEPGRSIVAKAGVTLYRVGTVKELPNGTCVAAVDGGMADNPRPMLYGAKYKAVLASRVQSPELRPVRIVGRNCEEGDTLIEEAWLPPVKPGDILAVLVSGAYQYTMSSNYNALTRPAVVHIIDGQALVAVERQTYNHLISGQRLINPLRDLKQASGISE